MAARKKNAVATRNSTALASAQETLSQEAANITDQISQGGGNKIKLSDKQFTFTDGTVDDGPIQVVIVDFVSTNSFYANNYDPNNPEPPICFAVGKNIKEMVPSPNSPEPQAKTCAECPMNQFGSEGNGKACKNRRKLALLGPDDTAPDAELMVMEVSPTGLKRYDGYVGTVAKLHQVPPIGVVTEIGFNPDVTYSSLTFKFDGVNENLEAHFARREEAEALLMVEPDFSAAAETKPARGRGRSRRGRAA